MFLRNCNQKPFTNFLIKKFHWGWTGLGTNQVKESKTETKRQLMGNKGWPKANEERECVRECVGCRYEFVFPSSLSWMVFECYSRGYHADFSNVWFQKSLLPALQKVQKERKTKILVSSLHMGHTIGGVYIVHLYLFMFVHIICLYSYMFICTDVNINIRDIFLLYICTITSSHSCTCTPHPPLR